MLSRLFHHVTLTICFERFDWSLAIGFLVSTNMASLLWTYEDEKFILAMLSFVQQNSPIFDDDMINDLVKEDVEDFYEFHFSLVFYSSFSFTFVKSLWKSELTELFRIPCSCGRSLVVIIGSENFLSLNLYVIRMSLSIVFVLLHLDSRTLLLWNLSFDLLSKSLLNLELIPSSQRQNDDGNSENSVYRFFGHLWTLTTS